jgi:mono/diheme cytochrome c family protein
MNKEVGYILQGFLLMILVVAGFAFIRYLRSMPAHPDQQIIAVNTPPVVYINEKGAALFKTNCAACHSLTKEIDGPSLFTAEERAPDRRLLYAWIRNSSAVLKSGNKYYNDLVARYGGVRMTDFPHLTDDDITNILQYIRQMDTWRSTSGATIAYK